MSTSKIMSIKTYQDDEIISFTKQVFNCFKSLITLAIHSMGPDVDNNIFKDRKKACEECDFKDLKGDIFFRKNNKGTPFCGVPIVKKFFRDPRKEGCGCFLNLKWKKKWAKCVRW